MTEFKEKFEKEFEKQKRETQKPNLVVVGGTGVGKSSLINRIFGYDIAKTGDGRPITTGINKYEPQNLPLVFFDTEGYEVAKDGTQNRTNFETKVIPEIEKMNAGELKDQVHLVWYCISITNHRVTEYDKLNIKYFIAHNMKTAIVFTQCDNDEELPNGKGKDATAFRGELEKSIPALSFFETCANKNDMPLDLEKLIEWSVDALPNDQLRQSFITSQRLAITAKKELAYAIVGGAAVTTGLTGAFNPIPVSDALVIAPQQLAMCVAITKIFWLNTGLSSVIIDLLKTQVISLAGKQVAASLLKLIPGFGQLINGLVAASITGGLGVVLVEGNAKAFGEFLETGKEPDWSIIFSSADFINSVKEAMNSQKNKE
jgi:GTP-binding protein EngB required for normal cell division/uncharacterized protein (DUF697 family)